MELYHIHLLGNHDNLYKENTVFNVDKNKFNNRLYNRIQEMNPYVLTANYTNILPELEYFQNFSNYINYGDIVHGILYKMSTWNEEDWYKNSEVIRNLLISIEPILLKQKINLRELALEEYRRANCPEKPSRLHSLFACEEKGLEYWECLINDRDKQVFKIEVYEEPFVSSGQLLPCDHLSYGEKLKEAHKYFYPKDRCLRPKTNEYLVQGKVKILKRIK